MWRNISKVSESVRPGHHAPAVNGSGKALTAAVAAAALGFVAYNITRKDSGVTRGEDDAVRWAHRGRAKGRSVTVGKTVLINRTVEDLYGYWRDFNNLASFMENVQEVKAEGELYKWTIAAPGGKSVQLETVVTEEKQNELIAWTSTENSQVQTEGRVEFKAAPGNRGTWVQAQIRYRPPQGQFGRMVAHLFRKAPEVQARHDLKRFKMLMETGEVATSDRYRAEQFNGGEH